jgi:hypothetical protein
LRRSGDLFFYRGAARAGFADAVGGPAGQVGVEFLASAADGINVEANDLGEEDVAAVTDLLGLQGSEPAALLLVEAAEEQVHLPVELPVGVRSVNKTSRAAALMNCGGHNFPSAHRTSGEGQYME